MHVYVPRCTRPARRARRDAYIAQLEQQSDADRERIASLKVAQRDMQQFIFQFIASQQNVEQPSSEGDDSASKNDGEA